MNYIWKERGTKTEESDDDDHDIINQYVNITKFTVIMKIIIIK